MELIDARNLAIGLMLKHGLLEKGWTFDFDKATSRLGICRYDKKQITISRRVTQASTSQSVEQTLLHEVAHALLPPFDANGNRIGHGPKWKALAASIGYTGQRTSDNVYAIQPKPFKPVRVKNRFGVFFVRSNDLVEISKGIQGRVIKPARTNFHINVNGSIHAVPFNRVRLIASAPTKL